MRLLRDAAVRRLLELDAAGALATEHVRLVAQSLDVAERTVFRWLGRARSTGAAGAPQRSRFAVNE